MVVSTNKEVNGVTSLKPAKTVRFRAASRWFYFYGINSRITVQIYGRRGRILTFYLR